LSASWSPALGPCGIPFFVVGAGAAFVVVDGAAVVVAGAAGADVVVGAAAGVDELDAVEPHAATPSAARTSRPAARRRADLGMVLVMFAP
jgi:hypothetical protein